MARGIIPRPEIQLRGRYLWSAKEIEQVRAVAAERKAATAERKMQRQLRRKPEIIITTSREVHGNPPGASQGETTLQGDPFRHLEQLSAPQLQAIVLMLKGLSNPEIAKMLGVALETVKQRLRFAFRTSGTSDRYGLLHWLLRQAAPDQLDLAIEKLQKYASARRFEQPVSVRPPHSRPAHARRERSNRPGSLTSRHSVIRRRAGDPLRDRLRLIRSRCEARGMGA